MSLVVRARRVVLPDGERAAAVHTDGGRITAVTGFDDAPDGTVTLADDEVLLPGLVDSHVHVNEPGRTEWEGFATATAAAISGGVTTIVDMPLNSIPPTTTVQALHVKQEVAKGQVSADVAFWGGAVPGQRRPAAPAARGGRRRVQVLPARLRRPGVPAARRRRPAGGADRAGGLRRAAHRARRGRRRHRRGARAERPQLRRVPGLAAPGGRGVGDRPPDRGRAGTVVGGRGARVHVVHLADGEALPMLRAARAEGVRITVETCPHYLTFAAEEVPDGATPFKCCPPIRERSHREALWAALADGDVDLVVSDHSPCTPDLKLLDHGDFGAAWGGIASLQVALPAVWTGARARGIPLVDVVRWMSAEPARLAGLTGKGAIAVGKDADLVAFAPEERWTVGELRHRNPVTPYAGRELHGVVRRTWLRGEPAGGGGGRLLRRGVPE